MQDFVPLILYDLSRNFRRLLLGTIPHGQLTEYREREIDITNLQRQVSDLEDCLQSRSNDWVVLRGKM